MNDKNITSPTIFTPSGCLTADSLMLFVSGSLEEDDLAKAEQHIAECPLCADAAEGLRMWKSDNNGGESLKEFQTHTDLINDRIKQRLHTLTTVVAVENKRLTDRPSVWFAAAAAIILFMGIGYIFWIQNQNSSKLQAQKQLKEREANLLAQMPESLAYPPSNSNVILNIKYSNDKKSHIPPVVTIVFDDVAIAPERVSHGGPNAGNNAETEFTETKNGIESDVNREESGMYKGKNTNRVLPVKNSGGAMKKVEADEETTSVFISVQQMPSFPGGDAARLKYLAKNLMYPAQAAEDYIQGTVYVSFVVKTDGRITNVKLLHGIGGGCDEEALRVVSKMPQWIPGYQNGKKVDVRFNMPVNFKLQ